MTELTAVKNDFSYFIDKTSTQYSLNTEQLMEILKAIIFEQDFISALKESEQDDGIIVNTENSKKIMEDLRKTGKIYT